MLPSPIPRVYPSSCRLTRGGRGEVERTEPAIFSGSIGGDPPLDLPFPLSSVPDRSGRPSETHSPLESPSTLPPSSVIRIDPHSVVVSLI
eukprot:scaffold1724_cov341-Pavlova_lutheri.AAC.43